MALPNSNISTSLVGQTLGSGSRDVGTLCTHPNINKWSKWKPVRFNTVVGLTLENLIAVQCGLTYEPTGSLDALISFYRANPDYQFTYERPRGGGYNEFYRLGDFRGYENNAYKWFNLGGFKPYIFYSEGSKDFWVSVTTSPGNINWSDMGWEDLYFGVMFVDPTQGEPSKISWTTNPFTYQTQGTWYATINFSGLTMNRSYQVYAFIGDKTSNYFALEGGYLGTLQYRSSKINNNSSGYLYANSGGYDYRVTYTLSITNVSDTPVILNNMRITVRYGDTGSGSLDYGEQERSLGTITVQPGASYVLTDEFSNCLGDREQHSGSPRLLFENSSDSEANRIVTLSWPS